MHKLGHTHVKTVHGTLDTSSFFRFSDENRLKLRNKFQLSNEYIIGFVFRNQLRKSVPNLLDGFKLFQEISLKNNFLVFPLVKTQLSV